MDRDAKRLIVAVAAGMFMSALIWLFISHGSPAHRYLMEHAEAGYPLLLLDFPALFLTRVLSGVPPSEVFLYFACFVQWFVTGLALSSLIWPDQTTRQKKALR